MKHAVAVVAFKILGKKSYLRKQTHYGVIVGECTYVEVVGKQMQHKTNLESLYTCKSMFRNVEQGQ